MSYLTNEQKEYLYTIRKSLDKFIMKITDSTPEINENMAILREWKPGIFKIGDIRIHLNIPYKCIQAHDSTANETWTPDTTPSLWMQYHGTNETTARTWIQPTGAHDMYKVDEYMIWTDGKIYKCIMDTIYSPIEYSSAWINISFEESSSQNSWDSEAIYQTGEYITYNGNIYCSLIDNNSWSPDEYPAGWKLIKE